MLSLSNSILLSLLDNAFILLLQSKYPFDYNRMILTHIVITGIVLHANGIACKNVLVITSSVLFTHKTIQTDEVITSTRCTYVYDH